jgi:hypothetical protein
MPRPTRLRFSEAFFGARTLDRFIVLFSVVRQVSTFRVSKFQVQSFQVSKFQGTLVVVFENGATGKL